MAIGVVDDLLDKVMGKKTPVPHDQSAEVGALTPAAASGNSMNPNETQIPKPFNFANQPIGSAPSNMPTPAAMENFNPRLYEGIYAAKSGATSTADERIKMLEYKLGIINDKLDVIGEQVKMIWDEVNKARNR